MTATVTLKVIKGELRGEEFSFAERTTCILGRASDCHPRLPNDQHHRTVSRHHCLLDINPPDIRVRDFGSLNGTYVNGVKIGQRESHLSPGEAAGHPYPEHDLQDGDEVMLGGTVFRVAVDVPAHCDECGKGLPRGAAGLCAECRRGRPSGDDGTRHCASCGRPLQAGSRAGVQLCEDCQTHPQTVANRLIQQAREGDRNLSGIARYTLLRELGRGGMGAVYLAQDDATGGLVALKVMLPKIAADVEARVRFLREAKVTSELRHPNIVAVHDVGNAAGAFYLTTEFCPHGSLDQLVRRYGGPLPLDMALPLALQAMDGLQHAHGHGIVHRDLSPQNILLGDDDGVPVAKVADFGLAKAFDQAGLSGLTRTGNAAGKPAFMPRQQVINFKHAKPEVDVWALAACLYWMLTGFQPRDFPARKDPWQVVLQDPAVPVRDRTPSIPAAVAEVIDEALLERPAIGFRTVDAFSKALRRAI